MSPTNVLNTVRSNVGKPPRGNRRGETAPHAECNGVPSRGMQWSPLTRNVMTSHTRNVMEHQHTEYNEVYIYIYIENHLYDFLNYRINKLFICVICYSKNIDSDFKY